MQIRTLRNEFENSGNDNDIKMKIARRKVKDLVAENVHRIFAEHTQVEAKTRIK